MPQIFLALILYTFMSPSSGPAGHRPDQPLPQDSISEVVEKIDRILQQQLKQLAQKDLVRDTAAAHNDADIRNIRKKLSAIPAMLRQKEHLAGLYMGELENYARLCDSVSLKNDEVEKRKWIRFMDDDLTTKFWFPGAGASPPNPLTSVKVKVKVLDNNGVQEMNGYTAFIKPKLSNLAKSVISFVPTTTAVKDVPPGVKLVWIEKDGKMVQSRVETLRRSMDLVEMSFLITK
jgi:hypothetical protein